MPVLHGPIPESDYRNLLCRMLQEYTTRHPERVQVAQRIREFVQAAPDCFRRSHREGHITGSAWLLNPREDAALLTLHRKLGRWLQPGGHADGDPAPLRVALREASEESGITGIRPLSTDIFDVDIHCIPARPQDGEPEHLHYDIRFVLQAPQEAFTCSAESEALAWWTPRQMDQQAHLLDEAVLRLRRLTWTPNGTLRPFLGKALPHAAEPFQIEA